MKNKVLVVVVLFSMVSMVFGVFLAPVVTAQEPEPTTMTLSWWNKGWNSFSLNIKEIFGGFFLLEFEKGGPAEKLMLGVPLHKNRGNEYFPCKIIFYGPAEVFEGQKINIFLVWEQNYGNGKGQMEVVPVQLEPVFLPAGYDSLPTYFSSAAPIRICREPTPWGGSPLAPQTLFNHSVNVKKLPSSN